MDTKFWNNLITGRKYEEEVASFFESQGFNVWRIGNFRLPVDLYVWDNTTRFLIEVKYRTNSEAGIYSKGLIKFLGRFNIPVFLIQVSPTSPFVARLVKSTLRSRVKKMSRRELESKEWMKTEKRLGDLIFKIKIGFFYEEMNWNELCTNKK